MKKTLVSALTTVMVIGAASTTFAAENPFSDVPTDHWAYDAVSQLAKDGVVEGYGDTSFQGNKAITRYEMAQIVAKAMAKEDQANAADKATIDKLAAEFSSELNSLGVRVSNLEKKTDNVKWNGEVRYTYTSDRHDTKITKSTTNGTTTYGTAGNTKDNANEVLFRLEPSATINNNWTAKARIDYATDMNSSANNSNATVDRAYVEGVYGNTKVELGKFPVYTEQGMILDDNVAGGQITFGSNKFATTLTAGRYNLNNNSAYNYKALADAADNTDTADYQSIGMTYKANEKFSMGAAYHHLGNGAFQNISAAQLGTNSAYNADSMNIWEVGGTYNFNKNVRLNGAYAQNTEAGDVDARFKRSYNIELAYKGAQPENKGSFGVYTAYRYLGQAGTIHPTFDGVSAGQKGWEFGTNYTFAKNIVGTVKYFRGKDLLATGDTNASKLFGRVEFFF